MQLRVYLRIVGYTLLALLTLEISARIDDYFREDAPLLGRYTINTLFRPAPTGRQGVPGARFAKWNMNSLGYRGPEVVMGRVNVLAFGASETFGLYESKNHEFPRVLEKILNETSSRQFNVINIALPGVRIGRVAYLEHALEKTNAKYVVVYPSPANYIGTETPFCEQASTPVESPRGPGEWIRLSGKLDEKAKKLIPPELQTLLRSLVMWSSTRGLETMKRVPEETIDSLGKDLVCIADAVQRRGATPVFVTHATIFGDRIDERDQAMLQAWRRFYPALHEDGFLDLEKRANERIRSVANQRGLPLVDAANAIPRGPTHFADFVHFTDKGAATMAQIVAPAIVCDANRVEATRPLLKPYAAPDGSRGAARNAEDPCPRGRIEESAAGPNPELLSQMTRILRR